jgi:hypothetical protein
MNRNLSGGALIYAKILNPETVPLRSGKGSGTLGAAYHGSHGPCGSGRLSLEGLCQSDYAKKNPGKLRVNTMGIGTASHFNLEIIQSLTGAQFTHVPFKGGESVITALLGGHVEMTFDAMNKMVPHVESGRCAWFY